MIDLAKKYTTEEGSPVELLFTNGKGRASVGGYIGTSMSLTQWDCNGEYIGTDGFWDKSQNLVEVKEPEILTRWVNFYEDGDCRGYETKEAADRMVKFYPRIGVAVLVTQMVKGD